mgnify:CR=1 FL=1
MGRATGAALALPGCAARGAPAAPTGGGAGAKGAVRGLGIGLAPPGSWGMANMPEAVPKPPVSGPGSAPSANEPVTGRRPAGSEGTEPGSGVTVRPRALTAIGADVGGGEADGGGVRPRPAVRPGGITGGGGGGGGGPSPGKDAELLPGLRGGRVALSTAALMAASSSLGR